MMNSGIASYQDVLTVEQSGRPADFPSNTYELIKRRAERSPDAPALSFFLQASEHKRPETWSYAQLLGRINQTANLFHSLGAERQTVIAYILPNLPETHWVLWGGQATGIVCAINPLLEPSAMAELLNASGASILVTLAPFPGTDLWPKVCKAMEQVPKLRELVLVNLADHTRGLKRPVARLLHKREAFRLHGFDGIGGSVDNRVRIHDLTQAIKPMPTNFLNSRRRIDPDDISSYFCTGGTTGTPKLAMRRHRNEVANAWSVAQFFGDNLGQGKVIFCGLPMFHVNAVLVTGLIPFSQGAHVILGTPQGYRGPGVVNRFWEMVEHHGINFLSGVPTLYSTLLQLPIGEHRLDSLEYGLCGAAPLPAEVMRNFQARTGVRILEGYGLTEGTCVSTCNPPEGERRPGSIGLRIPGQAMKAVVLDEQGHYERDCVIGEVGVLLISGPNVFAGYKLSPQNRGLWVDCGDDQCWLNTGDLGRQDTEGYFWLTGRKKELIIRGGHNIDPASIEEPLHRHPSVLAAAAVGRPDAYAGELPVAYVQIKEGEQVSESELKDFLAQEISERAAWPRYVRIIEELPLTGVGKIFKPELKQREIRDSLETALKEAGLETVRLHVERDPTHGVVIRVNAGDVTAEASIQRVLGRFPFQFTIEVPTAALA
ncbi:acyl-CoA synthetase [Marinobacter sp. CHS3-4]|uniref:acyl-CoA synthetase n=1 Tax=Marinobacter sp. CHS3-4 TaxID=3045174 RepID=UPI0024B60CAD|nr:acyl-CoA synthetase [Marinobacter sp. CHS3-4]MDI9244629.1 acyl-CoA synthetase [Marinobacter sp. CHS3-4]